MAAEQVPASMQEEEVTALAGDVGTKYKAAAEVVQKTLQGLIATQIVAGNKIVDICAFGDTLIQKQCETQFKKSKIDKGVAFPTCLNVNNVACHFSPLSTDTTELKAGDTVKIDLGAHFDGYIAVGAHTTVVPEAAGQAFTAPTGAAADVIVAAHQGAQIAARLIKVGAKNSEVTAALARVAEAYGVNAVQGTLMHQMKQYVIDGNKVVLLRGAEDQKVSEETFAEHDVFAVDVAFSTGEGKPKQGDVRSTVFKRAVENHFTLKMKASRALVSAVTAKFSTMPFTLRALDDEKAARMGMTECLKHDVMYEYPVLTEAAEDIVAQFKLTVLVTNKGTEAITGLELPEGIKSDKQLPEDLAAILAQPLHAAGSGGKRRRRKKKTAAAEADA